MFSEIYNAPWKLQNGLLRLLGTPIVQLNFALAGIPWGKGWRFHGVPIIQKHRLSLMLFGDRFCLRSSIVSNPLGAFHPVILCTWQSGAVLKIGSNFGMTGGTICAAEKIIIGDNVTVGANTTIIDTDFHPLFPEERRLHPQNAKTAPISIEDDVFIGMNCLILKGVTVGRGSVIGAGSIVTKDVLPFTIVAGNPAREIGSIPHTS